MISMKKNPELFWILEVLLLTPIALFWIGLMSMFIGGEGSDKLFMAVVGQPYETLRAIFVTIICPIGASWFAFIYLVENKKEKSATRTIAKAILAVSLATIVIVSIYLIGENQL